MCLDLAAVKWEGDSKLLRGNLQIPGGTMRGVTGLVLAGLGAFLILVAVLLPTWLSGQVIKFPLNEYETATLAASNASYFSPASLSEKTGVSMEATYTIKGDASKGNSSTAVWKRVQLRLRPDQPPAGPGDVTHVRVRPAHWPARQLLRREPQRRHVGPAVRASRVRVPDRHAEADLPGL